MKNDLERLAFSKLIFVKIVEWNALLDRLELAKSRFSRLRFENE